MPLTDSYENLVERLVERLQRDEPRLLIGLAGVPGSGKSTLAARLAREVNSRTGTDAMVAVGMDGFHLSKAALRALPDPEAAFARRGAPWTFDLPALAARVQALRGLQGKQAVAWPGFDHEVGDPVEGAFVVEAETHVVLVEGLYLLCRAEGWESVSGLFDERWYLDTPFEVAVRRLVKRHMAAWGITREEAERRVASNDGLNAEIVMETRAFSDWLVGETDTS